MLFPFSSIPVLASVIGKTTTTAKTIALGAAAAAGAAVIGKGLYDSGRKQGQREGQAAVAAEIQAQRARLDELESEL